MNNIPNTNPEQPGQQPNQPSYPQEQKGPSFPQANPSSKQPYPAQQPSQQIPPSEQPMPPTPVTSQTPAPVGQPPLKKPSHLKSILTKLLFILVLIIILSGLFLLLFRLPLKIEVSPQAKLLVDKKEKGEITSTTIWLKPGKHTIRLEKYGYFPETIEFNQPWFKTQNLKLSLLKAPELSFLDSGHDAFVQIKDNNSSLLYFNPQELAFFRYDFKRKQKTKITASYFYNLEKIKWSNTGNGVMVWLRYDQAKMQNTPFARPDINNGELATYYFDFKRYDPTQQQASFWGKNINEIAWSEVLGRFYYLGGPPTSGYLVKVQTSPQKKTRLITNIPSTGTIVVDSAELFSYIIGSPTQNDLFSIDLTDPVRELKQLTQENNKTHLVLVDDNTILLGTYQGNPEYKSTEKFQLFDILENKLFDEEIYAQKDWFYSLKNGWFIFLEAKQNSWLIKKKNLATLEQDFSYEYLNSETPDKIYFEEQSKTLIVQINNKIYLLPIL